MPGQAQAWPSRRGDPAVIRRQFGARAELLARALRIGDPLADDVIPELAALGAPAREQLKQGIRHGLASLTNPPPAIAALLRQAETVPDWATPQALARGSRTFLTVAPEFHCLGLGPRAVLQTYLSPSIAEVLVHTRRLVDDARRRLWETFGWVFHSMLPGAMAVGRDGYIATLYVRLLHARARVFAVRGGWDADQWGAPLGQVDLARTWLDFTLQCYRALTAVGFDFTADELAGTYVLWRRIAGVLGIDPALTGQISDHAQAERLLALLTATDEAPGEPTRTLITASVQAFVDLARDQFLFPPPADRKAIYSQILHLNGDQFADTYNFPRTLTYPALPAAVTVARALRQAQRANPLEWELNIKRNELDTRRMLARMPAPAEYELALD
ncbi:uncharacterized protein DUF2236 [Lentzea atacamensis]|uniref:Uncharacterized protein DUF2236 n=1 Tax=Lentzea atacamensis TaxID=531938 RepID=A0ABX9E1D6_9PSEU|nr:uncharacterized protein DUF2236 [Lentzea atacamensis]